MDEKLSALDYWYSIAVLSNRSSKIIDTMFNTLADEMPPILSVVGERACNLQCAHCIFQREASSLRTSEASSLNEAVEAAVSQMGIEPVVVHEGRIFRPQHLEWLKAVRSIRPDSKVGMIDNGTFLNHRRAIEASGFKFDWLDISIDGPEEIHNRQRRSETSFRVALEGIAAAPQFLATGGKVTSLFTLTALNFDAVEATSQAVPAGVSEWHITTVSPARPEIAALETDAAQFAVAWRQVVAAAKARRTFFRIYRNADMAKLKLAVGAEAFSRAVETSQVADVAVLMKLDGVDLVYYPTSVVVGEEVILDADAHHRLPYSIGFTLSELAAGRSRSGEDLEKFTVGRVTRATDLSASVRVATAKWREHFGNASLEKEMEIFSE